LLNECGIITDAERSMNCSKSSVSDLLHLFVAYSGSSQSLAFGA